MSKTKGNVFLKELKPIDYKILFELVKNSRLSDRQLSGILGVTQPTVSRRRVILEKEGLLEYSSIPNLAELGFEILAFTFGNWDRERFPDTKAQEMRDFIAEHPNIIFVSTGRGSGWDRMGISVHKDYGDYNKFLQEFRKEWGQYFSSLSSFIISFRSDNILRNISFKYVMGTLKEKGLE